MITQPQLNQPTFVDFDIRELNFHARINKGNSKNEVHNKTVLVHVACEVMSVTEELFYSKSRLRHVVIARMLVAVYLLSNTRTNLGEVGRNLGGKDHATVLAMHRRYSDFIDSKDAYLIDSQKAFIEGLRKINPRFSTTLKRYERKHKIQC